MAGKMRKLGLKVALAGLASYRAGIQSINKDNQATQQSMNDVAQGSKKLDFSMAALTGGMQALAGKGIDLVIGSLKKLGKSIYQMASESGVVAGLKGAFEGLSASVGVTGAEMLKKFKVATGGMVTMKDAMMSFNKAAGLISTDFATMLPDAMKYLGKVSRSTGASLDYLLDSLVIGVGRLSPMILDNLNIQVSLAEASGRAAEMFGVSTKALSKQQKQLGMANIVMEKLARNTAHMPDVTGSATAQMASFQTAIKDTRVEIGLRFLPLLSEAMGVMNVVANAVLPKLIPLAEGFANAIMGIVDWLKKIIPFEAIIKGLASVFVQLGEGVKNIFGPILEVWSNWGTLLKVQIESIIRLITGDLGKSFGDLSSMIQGAMRAITPVIQEVAKYLTYFFRVARDVFTGIKAFLEGDTERATKFFTRAFNTAIATVIALMKRVMGQVIEWGKGLIASYSKGIIEGIKTYLAQALQAVANFLRSFMAPGSAPKFLPDIGTWGADTMNEYIKGMADADFGLLSGVTSQFRTELAGMVQVGDLGAGAFVDTFFELRGVVTEVMDTFKETGKVAAGALDPVRIKLGKTGEALAELIEKQLEFGAVEKQLAEVAKQFDKISAAEEALSSAVNAAMSAVDAGLAEVALREEELDAALQPFINSLEKLRAQEEIATAELRKQYEAGEIGLEEYEDRVKAAKDQTKAAQQAFSLEKAQQIEARQALDTQETSLKLQEEAIRAEETAQQAILDQQKAIVQEEAAAIEAKRQALSEEMATLQGRLAFHRETLEVMKQQDEMLKRMAEKMAPTAAAGVGVDAGEGLEIALPEITLPDMEEILPDLGEELDDWMADLGPVIDLGELLPDVEETKQQISTWFSTALIGMQTAIQQSPIAQWILDVLFVKLPEVVEGLRTWIAENFPDAYRAISTAFEQAMAGDWPGAIGTMMTYFGSVTERIVTWWNADIQPVLDQFKLWWDTNWPLIQAVAVTAWTVIGSIVSAVIKTIVETAWPPLKDAIDSLGKTMASFGIDWASVWEAVKIAVAIVAGIVGAILLALVGIITGIVTGISRALANLIRSFQLIFNGIIDVIAGFMVFFKGVWEVLAGIFTLDFPRVLNGLKMVWVGFWTFLQGLFGIILGSFRMWFKTISEFIGGFVQGVIDFFKNLYTNLVGESIIPEMLAAILKAFTDKLTEILTGVGVFVAGVIQWFVDLWNDLLGPEGTVTKMGKELVANVLGFLNEIITGAGEKWEDFKQVGIDIFAGLWDGLKEKWQEVKGWILGRFSKIGKDVEDELEAKSPSQVFVRVGAKMAAGVPIGFDLTDAMKNAKTQMADLARNATSGWMESMKEMIPRVEREMSMSVAPALMMGSSIPGPINTSNTTNNIDQSVREGDRSINMPVTLVNGQGITLAQFQQMLRTTLGSRG